ncbi:MAG: TetR/AcrR family transcriptional regulator [Nitrospinae bacterium]|nr:TetR/AcrR family transcriptional regulator [Nitrospinota bacterium]
MAKGTRAGGGTGGKPKESDGAAKILAAAERLFAKAGFEAVSMNDVAKASGMSKANIFHHYKSKRDLYLAVMRCCAKDGHDNLRQSMENGASMGESLRMISRNHMENIFAKERVTRLVWRGLLEDGERLGRDLAEKVFGENFQAMRDFIRAGQKRGDLRTDIDPAALALVIVGSNIFYFQARNIFRHFPSVDFGDDMARYSEKLMDILLNGVVANPGESVAGKAPADKAGKAKRRKGKTA